MIVFMVLVVIYDGDTEDGGYSVVRVTGMADGVISEGILMVVVMVKMEVMMMTIVVTVVVMVMMVMVVMVMGIQFW